MQEFVNFLFSDNRVFKRINMDDADEDATITAKTANIGSQAKRRRVVLSSDDEDENELMKMEVEEVTPSTPKQGRKNIVRILFYFENFMVVEIFEFHYSILEEHQSS